MVRILEFLVVSSQNWQYWESWPQCPGYKNSYSRSAVSPDFLPHCNSFTRAHANNPVLSKVHQSSLQTASPGPSLRLQCAYTSGTDQGDGLRKEDLAENSRSSAWSGSRGKLHMISFALHSPHPVGRSKPTERPEWGFPAHTGQGRNPSWLVLRVVLFTWMIGISPY